MYEDDYTHDEGNEFEPAVESGEYGGEEGEKSPASPAPSASGENSAEETTPEVADTDRDTTDEEGEKVSAPEDEKSLEEVSKSVDDEIANDKHPKWFREKLKDVKAAFINETTALKTRYEPLADYEVNSVVESLEIVKGLDAIITNPETNLPERSCRPFVESLVKSRGIETVVNVMREAASLDSPFHPGWNLAHEVIAATGLDPARIQDYLKFQQAGYQVNAVNEDDLALVPEALREAFSSLSSEKRDNVLLMEDEMMSEYLEGVQAKLDQKRLSEENEIKSVEAKRTAEIKQQQDFRAAVDNRAYELVESYGSKLFSSFTESLVDAEVGEIESVAYGSMMSMILNADGTEAKAIQAALSKAGIPVDDSLVTTYQKWNEAAKAAAVFEKQGNEAEAKRTLEDFEDLQMKLIRKANPIIAAIAGRKAEVKAKTISAKSAALTEIQKTNNGIKAGEGKQERIETANGRYDFSDSFYGANEY